MTRAIRIAVFGDVHGDSAALTDALASIEAMGCDQVISLGDHVGYGPDAEGVIRILKARRIVCVRGNHDRAEFDGSRSSLSEGALRFLSSLPPGVASEVDGVRLAFCHARPGDDLQGISPDAPDSLLAECLDSAHADILFVGHTHLAMARTLPDGRMVVNPGALLRTGNPHSGEIPLLERGTGRVTGFAPKPTLGTFGVLELPSRRFIAYDAATGGEVEIERGPSRRPRGDRGFRPKQ